MKSSYYPAPTGDEQKENNAPVMSSTAPSSPATSTPKVSKMSLAFFSTTNYIASKMRCKGKGTLDDELSADFTPTEIEDGQAVIARRHTQ